ncbi:GGDEF domain-containing protein [Nitrogeniibacter mangrovi]|uniref:diguanylate cyclase n=1 Tax=Nitrogeniibacter mangrovi TaxID=2016596 RepID=A0A6C1B7U6_9RHOO|nr:diguanylate cyclase [Nitrogeniibacter mangrovi]QID19443.1 GGDEF domain-containing protein [Nitrogeniibacter mangrovi]
MLIAIGTLGAIAATPASAQALRADTPPTGPIGAQASILTVTDARGDDLAGVRARFERGEGRRSRHAVISAGIDAPATWLAWQVRNPTDAPVARRLGVDNPWIDQLDLYQVTPGQAARHWHTGDAEPQASRPVAGVNFAFDLSFPPGDTALYLRARTADPLVLPVHLESVAQSAARQSQTDFLQAFGYGYLVALIGYNLLIWAGVRKRSHLLYSTYLGSFVLLNLAYTGYGYAWLWPAHPGVQRYIILILMVAFSIAGLMFALRFLDMRRHAPALRRGVRRACVAAAAATGLCVAMGAQGLTATLAFVVICAFTPTMLWLGIVALRAGHAAARYFLAAAGAGTAGTLITALAVLGAIPFTPWTFHAAQFGMLTDATLLALALAHRFRLNDADRRRAEALARTDPLTGLLNRRAFYERADAAWSTAARNDRPLAAVVVDIDHFKRLNDTHGHTTGDVALAEVGRVLASTARRGDIVARWGGEEFVVLLPETDEHQAARLAERLRRQIHALELATSDDTPIRLSASFGVCSRTGLDSLDALIDTADTHLREAKQAGRNRVVSARLAPLACDATPRA